MEQQTEPRGTFQDVAEALALSLANVIAINANLTEFKPEDHEAAIKALGIDIENALAAIVTCGVKVPLTNNTDQKLLNWRITAQVVHYGMNVKEILETDLGQVVCFNTKATSQENAIGRFNRTYPPTLTRTYNIISITEIYETDNDHDS